MLKVLSKLIVAPVMNNIFSPVRCLTTGKWFNLAIKDKVAQLDITDEIGGWGISASYLVRQIKDIPDDVRIKVHIFSPGGDVLEGNEIYNALKAHKGGVDVEIGALCASIATVIACAGETITMAKNGLFMVHNPWTCQVGDANDFRTMATLLDKMKSNIITAYSAKTNRPEADLGKLMDDESWFTAEEALAEKFIDKVGDDDPDGETIQDRFDLSRFKNSAKAISRIPKAKSQAAQQTQPAGSGNTPPAPAKPPGSSDAKPQQTKKTMPTLADRYKSGSVRVFA